MFFIPAMSYAYSGKCRWACALGAPAGLAGAWHARAAGWADPGAPSAAYNHLPPFAGNVGIATEHLAAIIDHIKHSYPYWNRTGGRDHFCEQKHAGSRSGSSCAALHAGCWRARLPTVGVAHCSETGSQLPLLCHSLDDK